MATDKIGRLIGGVLIWDLPTDKISCTDMFGPWLRHYAARATSCVLQGIAPGRVLAGPGYQDSGGSFRPNLFKCYEKTLQQMTRSGASTAATIVAAMQVKLVTISCGLIYCTIAGRIQIRFHAV